MKKLAVVLCLLLTGCYDYSLQPVKVIEVHENGVESQIYVLQGAHTIVENTKTGQRMAIRGLFGKVGEEYPDGFSYPTHWSGQ